MVALDRTKRTWFHSAGTAVVSALRGIPSRLAAYAGAVTGPNRQKPPTSSASEDRLAHAAERRGLIDNARDLDRNFAPYRAMVAKHLNYVTEFGFQSLSQDEGWNRELEKFVDYRSTADRFDIRGIFDRESYLRTAEAESFKVGDVGTVALDSGHVMAVESDCIRSPMGDAGGIWGNVESTLFQKGGQRCIHGVYVNAQGRPEKYSVWKRRDLGGFDFDVDVPAQFFHLLAYRDRFDQVRGIGLMAAALNLLRDAGEGIDSALRKMKLLNALGVAFFTDQSSEILTQSKNSEGKNEFSLGKQVNLLNMKTGEDVKLLTAAHPSREFQDFMRIVLLLALQTAEIPYSFIDESFTNYSGARAAWLHYERACQPKRRRLIALLKWLTKFWLTHAIREREITLPSGMSIDTLEYAWVPQGMPWWKPAEEIQGDLAAIAANLTTFDRVCRERGTGNVLDNIRRNAAVFKFAESLGLTIHLVAQGSPPAGNPNDDAAGSAIVDRPSDRRSATEPQLQEAA